ncbi:Holliday junction resolvase RuvX [bacterium]|nr:Holliday junction resolvase RuvX [bacterium]
MPRILCLDYGERRIGVAVSDPLKIIASGLTTIDKKVVTDLFAEIKKICDEKEVERIVVGLPLNLKGDNSKKTEEVLKFVEELKAKIPIPVSMQDERLTTIESHKVMRQMGKPVGKNKNQVDEIAASFILRSYLDKFH